jgi:UDP-glucose 4-epimerase
MPPTRQALVTGGAGFIGSHVADAYLRAGYSVWIVDDLSTGRAANVPPAATFVKLDIRDERLADVFADAGGFDVVSHHAAQIDVRRSVADPGHDAAINVAGFLNVLGLVRATKGARLVFVSSGGVVYGDPDVRPTPETQPKDPHSPYGVSKLTAEYYLYAFHRMEGLDYVALRYANVYGPRQDPHGEAGVVAIFCNRLLAGGPLTVFGDGAQTRDYVYVGDVVSANLLLTDAALPPAASLDDRAFNVGTGRGTSVLDLAAALRRGTGRDAPLEHAPARAGELRHSALDNGRLRALGWRAEVELEEGLGRTFRHIAGGIDVAHRTG